MSIQANINLISIDADRAITEYNAQVLLMQGNDIQEFLTYDNEIYNELNHEPEEKIFGKNGSCDIFLMLELRRSHEAFSHSDYPCRIQIQITVNLN
ncbi:8267_t:CDS:2 [Funneliformis mosseae]|uniref:8267_t:CDS:1 n=1 Tax=Funneliformis mosseae TaxID=27381 RepID=A0A9N9B8P0_FUNMO|nr:8267_t:CDS:2 [Funneliformis mosseae]